MRAMYMENLYVGFVALVHSFWVNGQILLEF